MADKLYGDHQNGNTYILSFDVEKDASGAEMTVDMYISEIERLNPFFTNVYTLKSLGGQIP